MNESFVEGFVKAANIFRDAVTVIKRTGGTAAKKSRGMSVTPIAKYEAKQKALLAASAAKRANKAKQFDAIYGKGGVANKVRTVPQSRPPLSTNARPVAPKPKPSGMNSDNAYRKAGLGTNFDPKTRR